MNVSRILLPLNLQIQELYRGRSTTVIILQCCLSFLLRDHKIKNDSVLYCRLAILGGHFCEQEPLMCDLKEPQSDF